VYVDGRAVVRGRRLLSGDWNQIRTDAEAASATLWANRPAR
jgi:hypothetical protein